MPGIRPFLMLLALCVALPTPRAGFACSCADVPITDRFENSQILLLVKAGSTIRDMDNEGQEIRKWPFDIVELYKGQPTFEFLWSRGSGALCGANLGEGQHYLISTVDDGRIELCSVLRIGSDPTDDDQINVLNAHKYGGIPKLTEPWTFSKSAETCSVNHQFTSGGGYLQFFYRFKESKRIDTQQYHFPTPRSGPGGRVARQPVVDRGPHPSSNPGFLNLRIMFGSGRYVEEGSATLNVDGKQWQTRRTLMEAPWAFPYEVIDANETREVLGILPKASSISVTWTLTGLREHQRRHFPEYPQAVATTSSLFLGDAISNFLDCVDGGVGENN